MKKIHGFFVIVAIALLFCQTGLAKEQTTAQEWVQRGTEFESQHVYQEAIKMYTKAIEADGNYAEAYFKRAKAYMSSHRTNAMQALIDFNRAVDLDPKNAEAYYERGLLNSFVLNNENARDDMTTAANLGHKGAQQWFRPVPAEKGKGKEGASAQTTADASRQMAAQSPAAAPEEKSREKEGRYLELGEYLSSKGETVIHFDHNKSIIKERYHALLDEIALVLKEKIPEANITLAGYTDGTGTAKYNDRLSLQRAKAVESYLVGKHGISPDRFTVQGHGKSAPIDTNETEEGRAKNRRVELMIAGQ